MGDNPTIPKNAKKLLLMTEIIEKNLFPKVRSIHLAGYLISVIGCSYKFTRWLYCLCPLPEGCVQYGQHRMTAGLWH